jgi:hypothetical protein
MSRCIATEELEVHHKDRNDGNDIDNAQVLCHSCHEKTGTYGKEGKSPPDFSEKTRQEALDRAGHRCECEIDDCRVDIEGREINEILYDRFPR